MGFFSRLFGTKVNDSLPGNSYMFRLGSSTSGAMVNQRSAMQISAVYACVRVLAESIAGLPLHLYKCGKNGSREKAVEHPLYFLLHDEPNPEMTSFVFRETLMTHLLLCGTGIGLFLSREIIEKHGGTIMVTSGKKKKGSTFVIQLPYVG